MLRMKTLEPSIAIKMAQLDEVVKMGKLEKIPHTLYHIKTINCNHDGSVKLSSELNFFSIKTGQNDDNNLPTNYSDVNMDTPSAISQNYSFWGQSIRVVAFPAKDDNKPFIKTFDSASLEKFFINDIGKVLANGVVSLEVADKPLVRIAPLMSFPSGIGIKLPSITGSNFASAGFENGVSIMSNVRPIDLWLENNLTFKFRVNFYGEPMSIYNTFRLGMFIDGILYRPRA